MARTIQRMWDDEALAVRLAGNGRTFAAEECSEQRTVTYFIERSEPWPALSSFHQP